ncbi:MAG: hypothetical protein HY349_04895 [Nitrospirae bacterium]|nr:hypothetical protein [Nitrospirota bacterium]
MLQWSRIKDDLYHGIVLLRKGALTAAVYSSQEADRLKFQRRLQAAHRHLASAYRALGKYGLMKLQSGHPDFMKDKEGSHLVREIDVKRAELEKQMAERDDFDREEEQDGK